MRQSPISKSPILGLFTAAVVGAGLFTASSASAQARFYAYDPADAATRNLTRGVTLQAERRVLGGVRLQRLFSTSARGSAGLEAGGPSEVVAALPPGAGETNIYRISHEGDGRALARALCPGSDQTWMVAGRVRVLRPLVMHAVGQWPDGAYRHCASLSYDFRGEWATPPRDIGETRDSAAAPIER